MLALPPALLYRTLLCISMCVTKYLFQAVPDLVCASDRIEVKVSQSFVQDLQISGNGIYLFLASNYIPGSVVQDACKGMADFLKQVFLATASTCFFF